MLASANRVLKRAASLAGRRLFLGLFLRRFENARVSSQLGPAGAYRLANRRIPATEVEAVSRLLKGLGAKP